MAAGEVDRSSRTEPQPWRTSAPALPTCAPPAPVARAAWDTAAFKVRCVAKRTGWGSAEGPACVAGDRSCPEYGY
jgi:hypothetical protein